MEGLIREYPRLNAVSGNQWERAAAISRASLLIRSRLRGRMRNQALVCRYDPLKTPCVYHSDRSIAARNGC